MIYFDNAATTYPKPEIVSRAMLKANLMYGGNPGRSGHKLSMKTAEQIYLTRETVAEFFGAQPENVVFTGNCTSSLNTVIHGLYENGKTIITSNLEHNSVSRPVYSVSKNKDVNWIQLDVYGKTDDEIVNSFYRNIGADCCLVVCTHASNVTGQVLPIDRIYKVCKAKGVPFAIDVAQTAGVFPVKINLHADIICAAGHKGLYGPMGTGILILNGEVLPRSLTQGGTGSSSISLEPLNVPPDYYEAGTVNVPGIVGLRYGIKFVNHNGIDSIRKHELELCQLVYDNLVGSNIEIYTKPYSKSAPIFLFNFRNVSCMDGTKLLSDRGFAVRGGIHCAPMAHRALGTLPEGAIRFAPSIFNTKNQVLDFCRVVRNISFKTK